jgi:hypothetical protein
VLRGAHDGADLALFLALCGSVLARPPPSGPDRHLADTRSDLVRWTPCGWLKDRYGLLWQIVPTALGQMLRDEDSKRAERVMAAMLQMKKIDVQTLQQAYAQ